MDEYPPPSAIQHKVIGIVCAALVLCTVLIPLVDSINDGSMSTFTNDGISDYKVDGVDDYSIVSAPANQNLLINGERYGTTYPSGVIWICTDLCRVTKAGHFFQIYGSDTSRIWNYKDTEHLQTFIYDASEKQLTCTAYNGLTVDTGILDSMTFIVNDIIYRLLPGAGDYTAVDTQSVDTVYVNNVNQIYAGGAYTTGELDTGYLANGDTVYTSIPTYTGSTDMDTVKIGGYTDLYTVSDYEVTITDGSASETFTPYTLYVPTVVKTYTENASLVANLISIIPMLVAMGLIVVTAMMIRKRDEI